MLMIGSISGAGGLHPKSEIPDQPGAARRRLVIEWATRV
jgi:hypothetical protein